MLATVYRMQPKPGQESAVISHFARWKRGRGYVVPCPGGLLYRPRSRCGELIGAAVFPPRNAYTEQYRIDKDLALGHWYRELRQLLVADPSWDEGGAVEPFRCADRKEGV